MAQAELSNLHIAENGVIKEAAVPQLLDAANMGLLRLYSMFILSERDVVVQMYKHITNYHLLPRFAETNLDSPEPYKYIKDLGKEPFRDDVIRISEVYGNQGNKIPLNDSWFPGSIYTPQYNILQVPMPSDGDYLTVVYQAKPKPILEEDMDYDLQDVPWFLLDALRAFIAARIFSDINSPETAAKASVLMETFKSVCNDAFMNGQVTTVEETKNTKFRKGGWA